MKKINKKLCSLALTVICAAIFMASGCEKKESLPDGDIPFTELSLTDINLIIDHDKVYEDQAVVINSNEELEKYIDCTEGNYPEIDFSRHSLVLATGVTLHVISGISGNLQRQSGEYQLDVALTTVQDANYMQRWRLALLTDKLGANSKVQVKSAASLEEEPDWEELTVGMYETDFYYRENGSKDCFKIKTDRLILKCRSVEDAKVLLEQDIFINASVHSDEIIAMIDPSQITLADLLQRQEVIDGIYAFETVFESMVIALKTQLYVKFTDGLTPEEALDRAGLTLYVASIELSNPWSMGYRIVFDVKLGDILRICRELHELGLVKVAEPSCYILTDIRY